MEKWSAGGRGWGGSFFRSTTEGGREKVGTIPSFSLPFADGTTRITDSDEIDCNTHSEAAAGAVEARCRKKMCGTCCGRGGDGAAKRRRHEAVRNARGHFQEDFSCPQSSRRRAFLHLLNPRFPRTQSMLQRNSRQHQGCAQAVCAQASRTQSVYKHCTTCQVFALQTCSRGSIFSSSSAHVTRRPASLIVGETGPTLPPTFSNPRPVRNKPLLMRRGG